jgi:hypothetical protein
MRQLRNQKLNTEKASIVAPFFLAIQAFVTVSKHTRCRLPDTRIGGTEFDRCIYAIWDGNAIPKVLDA